RNRAVGGVFGRVAHGGKYTLPRHFVEKFVRISHHTRRGSWGHSRFPAILPWLRRYPVEPQHLPEGREPARPFPRVGAPRRHRAPAARVPDRGELRSG